MTKTKALITGVSGQDGSYMAEFLLKAGYDVYGMIRRKSTDGNDNIAHLLDKITLVCADLTDQTSIDECIKNIRPDEVYNLAAQSFVGASWTQPTLTNDVNYLGVIRLLEAIRKFKSDTRFYQASSSEMFGKVIEIPQDENTPYHPRSPYGVSKVAAHMAVRNYRESYGIFACCGICFNHESPRRGKEFVTRKITHGLAQIAKGNADKIVLGNIHSRRDWGFAGDYVEAMYMMLQNTSPRDYVIATGETHSVKEFLQLSCALTGVSMDRVEFDKSMLRPAEVDVLLGDRSRIEMDLGWKPTVNFEGLARMMVESDICK